MESSDSAVSVTPRSQTFIFKIFSIMIDVFTKDFIYCTCPFKSNQRPANSDSTLSFEYLSEIETEFENNLTFWSGS